MAKPITKLENGLTIKFLVKEKRYFLYSGSRQILINSFCQNGYNTLREAEIIGNELECNSLRFNNLWDFKTNNNKNVQKCFVLFSRVNNITEYHGIVINNRDIAESIAKRLNKNIKRFVDYYIVDKIYQ